MTDRLSLSSAMTTALLVGTLGWTFPVALRAEVAAHVHDSSRRDWGIIEDADPVGPRPNLWTLYRNSNDFAVLNPGGASRDDGPPHVHADRFRGGRPVAVWAYNAGPDHDIAFSEWNPGAGWSPIEFLTSGLEDDLDPHVFVEADGTTHVVWWRPGAHDKVLLSTRDAGADGWSEPTPVTATSVSARRPSVAVFAGWVWVAYERDFVAQPAAAQPQAEAQNTETIQQEILVTWRDDAGVFRPGEVLATTTRAGSLDPMIHTQGGKLWVDWTQADSLCAWSRATLDGWTAPLTQSWPDGSWVGMEEIRKIIQGQVMRAADSVPPGE